MPFSYERAKKELTTERAKLLEQLEQLETTQYEGIGYSNHMADDGTEAFDQAVGVAVKRKLQSSLEEVNRALTKFGDGTYGICETCGGRIDRARLKVFPRARYCLACQAHHEQNGVQVGSR